MVFREPDLALSFLFGDEFGSLAAFFVDAVASVLLAGLLTARHHRRLVSVRHVEVRRQVQLACGLPECGEHRRAVGFGGVGVPGGCGQSDGAHRNRSKTQAMRVPTPIRPNPRECL